MAPSMHTTYPVPTTSQQPVDAHPRAGRLVFHIGSAGCMIAGFQGLQGMAAADYMAPQYGGFFQYLTIIGLLVTIVFLLISSLQDMLPAVKVIPSIRRTLLLFALPIEVVISTIYWTIVTFKPDLMFPPLPKALAKGSVPSASGDSSLLFRIPLWMDISMHLLPALVLATHFFLLESRYTPPASTLGAPALAVSFGAAYSYWVEVCAEKNGKFPYPFLNVMSGPERVAMYVCSVGLALGAFWAMNAVHR